MEVWRAVRVLAMGGVRPWVWGGGREGALQVGVEEYLLRAVRSPQGGS